MAGPKHISSTSFKKGTSGNPGGRSPRVGPNGETWTQLARGRTVAHEERLHQLCMNPDPEIALKALALWLPSAWGRPPEMQMPEGGGKASLEEVLAELIRRLPA